MKFRFKSIAIVIFSLLILVCSYQAYWLVNFYNQQYEKLETVINNTAESSSFKELAIRMYTMSDKDAEEKDLEDDIPTSLETKTYNSGKGKTTISMSYAKERGSAKSSSDSIYADLQEVTIQIKKGLLSAIGEITPLDLVRLDSIMSADLSAQGFDIPHVIQCRTSIGDTLVTQTPKGTFDLKNSKEYVLEGLKTHIHTYYLYMDNPKWYIFKDMWGLTSVSVLMVILLIVTFIYLLKIILRQKTIDEIKTDFVNNMTHELKTPISVTYAAVDALQNFGFGDDPIKRKEYLDISREQLMYLNSLVEQILTMSVEERKNLKLNLENIEVGSIFESQKYKFLLNTVKPTSFVIDIQPEGLSIEADRLHFGNVVSNLIENAIKYSNDSVEIRLSARKSGNKIVLSVCDNGIGIPDGSLDKIFDKFYRVHTGNVHDVKGYGLGLFYVKTIVVKHGWNIKAKSVEGKGTCFEIMIG